MQPFRGSASQEVGVKVLCMSSLVLILIVLYSTAKTNDKDKTFAYFSSYADVKINPVGGSLAFILALVFSVSFYRIAARYAPYTVVVFCVLFPFIWLTSTYTFSNIHRITTIATILAGSMCIVTILRLSSHRVLKLSLSAVAILSVLGLGTVWLTKCNLNHQRSKDTMQRIINSLYLVLLSVLFFSIALA